MEVTSFAITLGIIGVGCACAALGALFARWLSEREIRALRSANRSEREMYNRKLGEVSEEYKSYREATVSLINKKDAKIRELKQENLTLRSELTGTRLRADIRCRAPKKA